jgi:hypothetical protein
MKLTRRAMAQHIADLTAAHGIRVTHRRSRQAWAVRGFSDVPADSHVNWPVKEIIIPPVRSQITYAMALHEIGHILSRQNSHSVLIREKAAWLWANKNALIWTDKMSHLQSRALIGYAFWGRRRRPPRRPRPLLG